jgi:hypothetical protein
MELKQHQVAGAQVTDVAQPLRAPARPRLEARTILELLAGAVKPAAEGAPDQHQVQA